MKYQYITNVCMFRRQGGDDVFMCLNLQTGAEVRKYWTEYQHNAPVMKKPNPLFNTEVSLTMVLYCNICPTYNGEDGRALLQS